MQASYEEAVERLERQQTSTEPLQTASHRIRSAWQYYKRRCPDIKSILLL